MWTAIFEGWNFVAKFLRGFNDYEGRLLASLLMFVDPCIIDVILTVKNPTRCKSVLKFYYLLF